MKIFFWKTLRERLVSFLERRPGMCLAIIVLYILMPIDVLPEAFLGPFGLFDDALAGVVGLALVRRFSLRQLLRTATRAPPRRSDAGRPAG